MMTFSLATKDDVRVLYGSTRETIRAICFKRDGVPVAICGLAIEPTRARFFSEHLELSCKELVQCWRGVKMAMQLVRNSKRPVFAVAEHAQGHKNLSRLGFVLIEDDYYMWGGS